MTDIERDPWALLGSRTPARIAIGRAGASLPTREVLSFSLAHARARDAVHAPFDRTALAAQLQRLGLGTVEVASDAPDRATYLRRPDLGRRLDASSREHLAAIARDCAASCDLALVIGNGLSATAVARQAASVVEAFLPHATRLGLKLGPVALAQGARVALGDDVGSLLGARLVAVLIGERPGLSACDSLGIYLTYSPRPGCTDAQRNCISNVRPDGLAPLAAARTLAWLVEAALQAQATGVALKDRSSEVEIGADRPGAWLR